LTLTFDLEQIKEHVLCTGVGWGMFGVSLITGIYYNMIIAWCFFYMFASFASDVPWRDCDHAWNSPGNRTASELK